MDINKLTIKTQEIISLGQQVAMNLGHQSIETGHILKAILNNDKDVTPYLLNDLKVSIGLELEENIEKIENSKNEWTLKRTFSRIIFYPFAIFIICFAIYGIYQGTVTRGIFGIFIAIAYLYTDIKIIRKKSEDF